MNLLALKTELDRLNCTLSLTEQGKLRFVAPVGTLTPELSKSLKHYKQALLDALVQRVPPGQPLPESLQH